MEVSPSVVAITVRPFIILLYNGEPLSNKLSGRPTGRQGNILQLGEEREGEVFGGDSHPLFQGHPLFSVVIHLILASRTKVDLQFGLITCPLGSQKSLLSLANCGTCVKGMNVAERTINSGEGRFWREHPYMMSASEEGRG